MLGRVVVQTTSGLVAEAGLLAEILLPAVNRLVAAGTVAALKAKEAEGAREETSRSLDLNPCSMRA